MGRRSVVIAEITDKTFDSKFISPSDVRYRLRMASRGILRNNGKIAVLSVTKKNYHKLPGGGIEENETREEAFKREILEETGCECENLEEVGMTVEIRDTLNLIQLSYVFTADVVGTPKDVDFTQKEKDEGFELVWMSLDEALGQMKKDRPSDYSGTFINKRDIEILGLYTSLIQKI